MDIQIQTSSCSEPGNAFTGNVTPLLHEIKHALEKLLNSNQSTQIDLRSIPMGPGEEDLIIQTLGQGELSIELHALGLSNIHETQYFGVWVITHLNENQETIGRFIEINYIPDILKTQKIEIEHSLEKLQTSLDSNSE